MLCTSVVVEFEAWGALLTAEAVLTDGVDEDGSGASASSVVVGANV
jgi:hypothetical protein